MEVPRFESHSLKEAQEQDHLRILNLSVQYLIGSGNTYILEIGGVYMVTSIELLDRLKQEKALSSDYKLALYLDKSFSAISGWRKGKPMGEDTFIKIGKELEIDEDELFLSLLISKQKNSQVKGYLERKFEV
jgi:hypothetical protein